MGKAGLTLPGDNGLAIGKGGFDKVLRKVTILLAVIVIAWWMRDGDPQALRHDIIELRDRTTQFAPDGATRHSDWGRD